MVVWIETLGGKTSMLGYDVNLGCVEPQLRSDD